MSSPPLPSGTAPASPPGAGRPLPAAIAGVAGLLVLLPVGQLQGLPVGRGSRAADVLVQVSSLVLVTLDVLLAVLVVLLVQRATSADGRIARTPALLLGLFTLAQLLSPLGTQLAEVLMRGGAATGGRGGASQLLALAAQGLPMLALLALGILALRLALHGAPVAPVTVRLSGSPAVLALALAALALVILVLAPLIAVMDEALLAVSAAGALLHGAVSLVSGLARALLVPIGALLIARTAGTPRRLVWIALAVHWAGTVAAALVIQVLVIRLLLGSGTALFALWNGLNAAVQVIAALVVLVLAAVVLVQTRGRGEITARPERTP